jgi:CPA2 family monovalent cation:H+ antiporter-2
LELADFVALAAVFAFAFVGGHIAQRLRQPVMVGYIVAGVVLGTVAAAWSPLGDAMYVDPGTRQLSRPVQAVFDLGITFLMFFTGMEISIHRLSRAGRAATILALADTGLGFLIGGLVGVLFGWSWTDIFFLGGIIVMSSLSVAAKSLIELRRLDNKETEFLLSAMVVEAFISMVLLTLSTSFIVVSGGSGPSRGMAEMGLAVALVYVTLIAVAVLVVPRLARGMAAIRHEEVFILLALTMVFSAAALSWAFGLPFMIGAFFMGVAFSETALTDRLRVRLMSLKDAFTAAFFVGFGILINLALLVEGEVALIVAVAIPLIILNEAVLTSTVGFLIGLGRRESVNLGTAFLGRAEDAVLFASVGGRLKDDAGKAALPHGSSLYPFAGGVSLVMSVLTPKLMKVSVPIADALASAVPGWLRFGATLVQRTLSIELGPETPQRPGRSVPFMLTTLAFLACVLALIGTFRRGDVLERLLLVAVAVVVWAAHALAMRSAFRQLGPSLDLSGLDLLTRDREMLADHVSYMLSALLLIPLLVAAAFPLGAWTVLAVPAAVLPVVLALSRSVHRRAVEPPLGMSGQAMLDAEAKADGKRLQHGRGGGPG